MHRSTVNPPDQAAKMKSREPRSSATGGQVFGDLEQHGDSRCVVVRARMEFSRLARVGEGSRALAPAEMVEVGTEDDHLAARPLAEL
jgi:hypothetical protein